MPRTRRAVRLALLAPVVAAVLAGGVAASRAGAEPKGWKLPADAKLVGDDVYEIGTKQVNGKTLTGWAFVHRGHNAKPSGGGSTGSKAYAYIAAGLKWKTFGESYVVDPTVTNWDGASDATYIRSVISGAVSKWEDAANGSVGDGTSVNIFGNEVSGTVDRTKIGNTYNNVNEVCFAPIAENNVIAVTMVWGYYSGPASVREIVEWDQIYDDDGDFTWGDVATNGNADDMDFDDIATHEVGHAFGMDHPGLTYSNETMYAYASEGETKKRSLNAGDITGINGLY
jgi:hypothetical protein